jgi:hypothetical protein
VLGSTHLQSASPSMRLAIVKAFFFFFIYIFDLFTFVIWNEEITPRVRMSFGKLLIHSLQHSSPDFISSTQKM